MRGVGDEAPLRNQCRAKALIRVLELSKHLIETALQPTDLIIRSALWQAPAQVLCPADVLSRARHRVERPQGAPRYEPARPRCSHQAQEGSSNEE